MPAKLVSLDGIGSLKIYKRRGVRSVRLSIVGDGTVRVTQPNWLPYRAGIEFAMSRKKWIIANLKPSALLRNEQIVGKSFVLQFVVSNKVQKPTGRISGKQILVRLPEGMHIDDESAQNAAKKAIERALKSDTEELLIPRLRELAQLHGFTFNSVTVKKLKSRWGSCSQHKDIILSSYLIQLPWELIDYVLLHELQHTEILAHGSDFWDALSRHVANLKQIRKDIKTHQARIG